MDTDHYAGKPVYRGASMLTGWLEAIGRPLLKFQSFTPDRWVEDGEIIDILCGLKAVHLKRLAARAI